MPPTRLQFVNGTRHDSKDMTCGFCFNAGIKGPHGHKLRQIKGGAITCPILKETKCQFCFKKGHTKLYCKERGLASEYFNNSDNSDQSNHIIINIKNESSKRPRDNMQNEWQSVKAQGSKKTAVSFKSSVCDNFLSSAFAALEVEDESVEDENVAVEVATLPSVVVPNSLDTWTNIVKRDNKPEKKVSFCIGIDPPTRSSSKSSLKKTSKSKQDRIQELRDKLGMKNLSEGNSEWFMDNSCDDN